MGLFSRNSDEKYLQYCIEKLNNDNEYIYLDLVEMKEIQKYRNVIKDDELLGNIIIKLTDMNKEEIILLLDNLLIVYCDIVKNNDQKEINQFKNLIEYFIKNSLDIKNYQKLSSAFDDKRLIFETLTNIESILDIKSFKECNVDNLNELLSYPINARQYYLDDRQLFSSFVNLINQEGIRDYLYSDAKISKVINKKLKEDKKQCGIYDIDQGTLSEIDHKLNMIDSAASNLKVLIDTTTSIMQELKSESKRGKDELIELKLRQLEELQNKANKILSDFNNNYLQLLNEERESFAHDKEELFAELDREIEKRKEELKILTTDFTNNVTLRMTQVDTVTNKSIKQIEDFINNNDSIKQMITETRNNEDFIATLKEISNNMQKSTVVAEDVTPNLIIPNIIAHTDNREVDNTVNYFYDTSISFNERFEKFQKLKEQEMKKGVIFHEKFDDIVTLIMMGQTPYMYGPSGCGKTYMIESQISKLLNTNVVTNGYVLYEQDIIGYTNSATGDFVPGNFYRSYKYGDIIFLDELDNGIANATVVLNRFLGKANKSYMFPDGLVTNRNPNFRIITAGNTSGDGRTLAHNTRQKMDESVMQRLVPIEVDYDNRVEESILKDYPDWYYFAVNFRKAIESIPGPSGERNTIGTFTTRDANSVKDYLDQKAFDNEAILEYEIIQTKDIDTLQKLSNVMHNLEDQNEFKKGSEKILRLYDNMIKRKRVD